jgi:ATP-dependent Zn protease
MKNLIKSITKFILYSEIRWTNIIFAIISLFFIINGYDNSRTVFFADSSHNKEITTKDGRRLSFNNDVDLPDKQETKYVAYDLDKDGKLDYFRLKTNIVSETFYYFSSKKDIKFNENVKFKENDFISVVILWSIFSITGLFCRFFIIQGYNSRSRSLPFDDTNIKMYVNINIGVYSILEFLVVI